jgi:hypothetical protein
MRFWRILAFPEKVPGFEGLDAGAMDTFRRDYGINRIESTTSCILFSSGESIG